ncbi:SRPBCC family protein [Antrihabitans spumae]|jgi:uncharacterized protein YndB with AHSA1/START domain|uniref:SRPBCC family protein n=2 Tax=Antrihabitans spumae TaxID=3373370 RepID=A0ABW7JMI1_9NOCA
MMSTTDTKHETEITAGTTLPTIVVVREFDAPVDRVHRAWTDPVLFAQWLGPKSLTTRIEQWDCRTGGSWRYSSIRDGEAIASFFGSFHEIRADRIVQTFTYVGFPDGVALETIQFDALAGDRTRITSTMLVDSFEGRDGLLSSGMDVGVTEGYVKLDELLGRTA